MNGNGSRSLLVMAIVKGILAVMLVGTACYAAITGLEIGDGMMGLILAVVGVYFGFSSRVYLVDAKHKARQERIVEEVAVLRAEGRLDGEGVGGDGV